MHGHQASDRRQARGCDGAGLHHRGRPPALACSGTGTPATALRPRCAASPQPVAEWPQADAQAAKNARQAGPLLLSPRSALLVLVVVVERLARLSHRLTGYPALRSLLAALPGAGLRDRSETRGWTSQPEHHPPAGVDRPQQSAAHACLGAPDSLESSTRLHLRQGSTPLRQRAQRLAGRPAHRAHRTLAVAASPAAPPGHQRRASVSAQVFNFLRTYPKFERTPESPRIQ